MNSCQERILEVRSPTDVVACNLYTVATVGVASGTDGSKVL